MSTESSTQVHKFCRMIQGEFPDKITLRKAFVDSRKVCPFTRLRVGRIRQILGRSPKDCRLKGAHPIFILHLTNGLFNAIVEIKCSNLLISICYIM